MAEEKKQAKIAPKDSQGTPEVFAVIEAGGKQHKVSVGDTISIEKLSGEYEVGNTITFDKIVLLDDGKTTTIGAPYVEKAKVTGELMFDGKGKKLTIQRFKSKSNWDRKIGHRQPVMKVKIAAIS